MRKKMIVSVAIIATSLSYPLFVEGANTSLAQGAGNPLAHISCANLEKQKITKDFLEGELIHGTVWSALFAAYFHNCQSAAVKFLKAGADPNYGGWEGTFSAQLVSSWPHKNPSINKQWIKLLVPYGLNLEKNRQDYYESGSRVIAEGARVDYPDILADLKAQSVLR